MSLWRDDPPPAPATNLAVLACGAVAIASLSRLFDGGAYAVWAVTATTVGTALALTVGRRRLALSFLILVVGGSLSLPALFATEQTALLLPTTEAVSTVRALFVEGFTQAPESVPPVAADPHYAILVWTAFLLLGYLAGAWVVVRRPAGAVITALGVIVFAGGIGDGPGRDAFAVAAIAATGAFFLSEGRHRIGRWAGVSHRLPAAFGVPTLLAAVAIAGVAPQVLGDTPVVNVRSALRPRLVIIKPLSDIQRQLQVDPPIEVMRVEADRPTYWRLTGLDSYDGTEWVLNARPEPVVAGDVPTAEPATSGEVLTQTYHLTSLLAPWLPAAYAATSVRADTDVEIDRPSQTLLLPDETSPGLSYTVTSRLPSGERDVAVEPRAPGDPREELFGRIAAPIVGDASTPLQMARRLEAHFRAFAYDEDVEGGHTTQRLQRFLEERTGYCEQFAATMTLMLRGLGVDARVGVGFLPGAERDGTYVVSTDEAHAWVEAAIPGIGWMSFDPTPARDGSTSAPPQEEAEGPASPPPPQPTSIPRTTPAPADAPADLAQPEPAAAGIGGYLSAAVAILALAAIPGAKRLRRLRRRAAAPTSATLGAFAELSDRAADLGHLLHASETHREFSDRTFGRPPTDGAAAARRLTELTLLALYAPEPPGAREAAAAWQTVDPALRSLRRSSPWWRRMVAVLDPRTLIPIAARTWPRSALARLGGPWARLRTTGS